MEDVTMRTFKTVSALISATAVVTIVRLAGAVPLPDHSSADCGNGSCFGITNTSSTGFGIGADGYIGVAGQASAPGGAGVKGFGQGFGDGVLGVSDVGYGVEGFNGADSATAIFGTATGNNSIGVHGDASASASTTYGVEGSASSTSGVGVYAHESAATGTTYGLYAVSDSSGTQASGVYGHGNTGGAFNGVATGVYTQCSGPNCNSLYVFGNATVTGCAKIDGTTYGSCSSDRRLKKNIEPLVGALDDIAKLRPVTYEWIDPSMGEGKQVGFIAQDVEEVKPEWVTTDDRGFKKINMGRLPTMLVESVRTLKAENDDLRERVKALEAARRPSIAGFGDGWIAGVGLLAVAGAIAIKRRRPAAQSVT